MTNLDFKTHIQDVISRQYFIKFMEQHIMCKYTSDLATHPSVTEHPMLTSSPVFVQQGEVAYGQELLAPPLNTMDQQHNTCQQ